MRSQSKISEELGSKLHLFQVEDCYLAYDVNSGSLHRLDQLAWLLVREYLGSGDWEIASRAITGEWQSEEIAETIAELQELVTVGQLFSRDQGWELLAPGTELGLKALCLNIAHSCNLACRYCFVPDEVRQEQALMSPEVIKEAIDLLLRETPYHTLCVDFFGGEPLLNFDGVKYGIAYAKEQGRDKQWKFTLTTNALLLGPAELAFLRAEQVSLVLSCDGRPEVHDRYRVTQGGKGSHQRVVERLRAFLESGACQEYYLRGTYTHQNLDFGEDVRYLAELGGRSISLEPVVAPPGEAYAIQEEDLEPIRQEYFRLGRWLRQQEAAGQEIAYYHFNIDLPGGPCVAKRLTGCGAGYQYLAVTPSGKLYPCHQLVGQKGFQVGDVWQGVTEPALRERFRSAHLFKKEACRSCWVRFLCGGGCHAQAALMSGDLLTPYQPSCAVMRARLEGALYYLSLGKQQEAELAVASLD